MVRYRKTKQQKRIYSIFMCHIWQAAILLIEVFIPAGDSFGQQQGSCSDTSFIEVRMKASGLVNVRSLDSTIMVELRYSTTDNFLQEDLYGDLCNCYLRKEVGIKLVNAQKLLRKRRPDYSILVYDCVRPRSIQRKMWDKVKGTPGQAYVANPGTGSIHNFGCAVDVTIADSNGLELDMGTPFDFFGELAQPRYEEKFLSCGELSKTQIENRKLLREVMVGSGFEPLNIEWWHYNGFPKNETGTRFSIIE